jgi:hypothetical protein
MDIGTSIEQSPDALVPDFLRGKMKRGATPDGPSAIFKTIRFLL